MFEFKTIAQVKETMSDKSAWVIDEVISSSTTLLYGESEAGKSFLVSALIASLTTGKPFLGREVPDHEFKVLVAYTDDAGDREYVERIESALPSGQDAQGTILLNLPVMRTLGMWQDLLDTAKAQGINFLVIDNLTQAIDGEMNKDKPVRDFFEGVRLFVKEGIPVVVVGHSSEKTGMNGGKSDRPMGHSAIVQSIRWRIFVRRNGDVVTLKFAGNHAKPHEIKVKQGLGAVFEELSATSSEEIVEKKQRRDSTKLDTNNEIAAWVVANCQGASQRQTAKAIADKFGGSWSSYQTSLSKRDLSGLLTQGAANGWGLK